jgi:hypothetical protein
MREPSTKPPVIFAFSLFLGRVTHFLPRTSLGLSSSYLRLPHSQEAPTTTPNLFIEMGV